MSGVEKNVRETMPIQEEERASESPAAKARPMLKPSSTSNPNPIPMRERKWIDIEVRKNPGTIIPSRCENLLLNYFDSRKLVEKKMPEFLMFELLRNLRKFYQKIQDVGQTKFFKI